MNGTPNTQPNTERLRIGRSLLYVWLAIVAGAVLSVAIGGAARGSVKYRDFSADFTAVGKGQDSSWIKQVK